MSRYELYINALQSTGAISDCARLDGRAPSAHV